MHMRFASMAFIMIMRLFKVRDGFRCAWRGSRFDGRAFSCGRRWRFGGGWRRFVGLASRAAGRKSEQAGG